MQVALENEQSLSGYVSHARLGEEVVLTEHGRPVARIVATSSSSESNKDAVSAIRRLMESGLSLGGQPYLRDELYDRD